MLAHRYELGKDIHEKIYDVMVQSLANGAVLGMRGYLEWRFEGDAPVLSSLNLGYRLPEGRDGDASCQVTPIGAAFFDECSKRGAITCNEAAIYHAAWEQQRGCEAWVHIVRPDNGTPHAVVYYPGENSYYDPSREMLDHNQSARAFRLTI